MNIARPSPRKLILFTAVVLAVGSLPMFGTRFLNDMDFYALVANKLLSGRVLYRDAMDTKPPLVFLHYALVFKLFGLNNVAAVKVVTIAWFGLSATLMAALGKTLVPAVTSAALASLLFILSSISGWGEDFLSSNTEILANLFILAGVWAWVMRDFAYSKRRLLLGGVCIGIACLYRYQSGAALVAYTLAVLLRRRDFDRGVARIVLATIGAALPSILLIGYYFQIGALTDLRLLLAYQTHYVHDGDAFSVATLSRRILIVLAGQWLWLLLAIRQAIAILRRATPASRSEVFHLLFAALSLATFFAGGRFFPHYFVQAIPPLVLLAFARLQQPQTKLETNAIPIAVSIATAFTLINGSFYWTRPAPLSHPNVVAFVEAKSTPNDEVLLWAWRPELLFETNRAFATRLLVNEVLIGRYDPAQPQRRRPAMPGLWTIYLQDLAAAPPKLLFDALPGESHWPLESFPPLAALLARYEPCIALDDICVYLRKD